MRVNLKYSKGASQCLSAKIGDQSGSKPLHSFGADPCPYVAEVRTEPLAKRILALGRGILRFRIRLLRDLAFPWRPKKVASLRRLPALLSTPRSLAKSVMPGSVSCRSLDRAVEVAESEQRNLVFSKDTCRLDSARESLNMRKHLRAFCAVLAAVGPTTSVLISSSH